MPSSVLQTVLSVGPLAPGAEITQSHGLNIGIYGQIPTFVRPDRSTPIVVVGAPTITNVTFRNDGIAAAEADFLVQLDHSIQQATPPALAAVRHYWRGLDIGPVAYLNRHNTFTQAQGSAEVALADNVAGIDTDLRLGNVFDCQLEVVGGNTRVLNAPTFPVAGFTYMWIFRQPAAGAAQLLTYNAVFLFPGGIAPVLSVANNDIDIMTAVYDGAAYLCVSQLAFA